MARRDARGARADAARSGLSDRTALFRNRCLLERKDHRAHRGHLARPGGICGAPPRTGKENKTRGEDRRLSWRSEHAGGVLRKREITTKAPSSDQRSSSFSELGVLVPWRLQSFRGLGYASTASNARTSDRRWISARHRSWP